MGSFFLVFVTVILSPGSRPLSSASSSLIMHSPGFWKTLPEITERVPSSNDLLIDGLDVDFTLAFAE